MEKCQWQIVSISLTLSRLPVFSHIFSGSLLCRLSIIFICHLFSMTVAGFSPGFYFIDFCFFLSLFLIPQIFIVGLILIIGVRFGCCSNLIVHCPSAWCLACRTFGQLQQDMFEMLRFLYNNIDFLFPYVSHCVIQSSRLQHPPMTLGK